MRLTFIDEMNKQWTCPPLDAIRDGEYYIQPSKHFWKTGRRNVICPNKEMLKAVLRQYNPEVEETRFEAQWEVFSPYLKDPGLALMMRDFGIKSKYFVPFCLLEMLKRESFENRNKLPWLVNTIVAPAQIAVAGLCFNMNGDLELVDHEDPFFRWILRAPIANWIRESRVMTVKLLEQKDQLYHIYCGYEALTRCARSLDVATNDACMSREILAQIINIMINDALISDETFVFNVTFDHWSNRLAMIAFGRGNERPWLFADPQELTEFLEMVLENFATTYEIRVDQSVSPVGAMVLIKKLEPPT